MAEEKPIRHKHASRIKDARGRSVTQLDPVLLRLLRQYDVMDAGTLRTVTSERGVQVTTGERAALFIGFCCALLVFALFTIAVITGGIRNAPIAKSASLLYLGSIPWIIWFGIKRKRIGNIATAMLKYSRCPHCGYDLRLLPTDPRDGATICPECGCAWKIASAETPVNRNHG